MAIMIELLLWNGYGQVTKRVDTNEGEWSDWNWRTEGDIMVNGAFFVPSGAGASAALYAQASSVQPKSAVQIDQLTMYSGVFGDPRYSSYYTFINILKLRF